MACHMTALLPNSCSPMADDPFRDLKGPMHTQISDPSMKDWYQYHARKLTHRAQLRESSHMTNLAMALPLNRCGPMADGPFRDPEGRSSLHPKYWTHRLRIGVNISHGISPIEPSYKNQSILRVIWRMHYQIAAAQWWMVHVGTPRVGHIQT